MNPDEGNVTVVRLLQASNVPVPSDVSDVALRSTDVRAVSLRPPTPIDVSDAGKLSDARLEHR